MSEKINIDELKQELEQTNLEVNYDNKPITIDELQQLDFYKRNALKIHKSIKENDNEKINSMVLNINCKLPSETIKYTELTVKSDNKDYNTPEFERYNLSQNLDRIEKTDNYLFDDVAKFYGGHCKTFRGYNKNNDILFTHEYQVDDLIFEEFFDYEYDNNNLILNKTTFTPNDDLQWERLEELSYDKNNHINSVTELINDDGRITITSNDKILADGMKTDPRVFEEISKMTTSKDKIFKVLDMNEKDIKEYEKWLQENSENIKSKIMKNKEETLDKKQEIKDRISNSREKLGTKFGGIKADEIAAKKIAELKNTKDNNTK